MNKFTIRDFAFIGLSIALITIGTMVIQIPIPATNGYIHVGDGIILLVAATFGSKYGMIAGGVGSSLADIITGYTIWAPFTFIIKGLMGYIMGMMSPPEGSKNEFTSSKSIIAAVFSSLIMIIGYFFAESLLSGNYKVALFSIPWNSLQSLSGIILYILIGHLFQKVKIRKSIKWR